MHRTLQITLPATATDEFCRRMSNDENVIGLSVSRNASLKPPGDAVTIHVLNRGADDVLRAVAETTGEENYSIATSVAASLIDPEKSRQIARDVDESIWEEMENGLRHQGRVTPNFILLMWLGGTIAAVSLVTEGTAQAMAVTASAIIAPGFEPLAKITLGAILKSWETVRQGIYSTAIGYAVLILSAAATMFVMLQTGGANVGEMIQNQAVESLVEPKMKEFVVSLASAAAGVVMIAAYRKSVIAGPLIGLVIIQAAALVGAALAAGSGELFWEALRRFALDVAFIIGFGLLVFYLKQVFTHKRKPLT